jgi:hypothetical protein
MRASDILRIAAAHLNVGDEVPIAGFSVAIPHFFVRVTAICVERRQIGVLREFLLRGLALGLTTVEELAGLLGVREAEVTTELAVLEDGFYTSRQGAVHSLMEKGRAVISVHGLPQAIEREAACYVNGVTRDIEQFAGELLPRRKLLPGTLVLPAVPARPPRVEELQVAGVKAAMLLARNSLPRSLEIARLGRVLRASSLFATGHLFLRRGIHGVPLVCVNGAANTDLARPMGAHPALRSLKAMVEKNEKRVRHQLSQLRPKLRTVKWDKPEAVRLALTCLVALSDAEESDRSAAETAFKDAARTLLESPHWISGLEVQVLIAGALMTARESLVMVVPQISECFGLRGFDGVQAAVRRGVKVQLQLSPAQLRFVEENESYRAIFHGAEIVPMNASGEWCGCAVDAAYAIIGACRSDAIGLGRSDTFFGALLTHEPTPSELLRDFCVKGGALVTIKSKKRLDSLGDNA